MNIKKILLGSTLVLFATTLNANGQPWDFGVKAGGGMSWLRGLGEVKFDKNGSTSDYNWIGAGGLTTEYALHENISLGLELLYTTLGGQAKEKLTGNSNKTARCINVVTHNLAMPIMAKLLPMGRNSEAGILDIHAGVQIEMPFNNSSVKVSDSKDRNKLEKDVAFQNEYFRSYAVSFISGIGYEFPKIGLKLEGRYSLGLTDTFKDTDGAKAYKINNGLKKDQKLVNQSLVFSVGYNFAELLLY